MSYNLRQVRKVHPNVTLTFWQYQPEQKNILRGVHLLGALLEQHKFSEDDMFYCVEQTNVAIKCWINPPEKVVALHEMLWEI